MKKLTQLLAQLFCRHKYQYTEINHDGLNTMECKWCGKKKVVKVLFLLALAFVMCGCMKQYIIEEYGVVEGIKCEEHRFVDGVSTKYVVTLSKELNGMWKKNVILFTNENYSLGDTIKITKKNNP